MAVVAVSLLATAGSIIYANRTGAQAARQTVALQYAKQLIQLSKLYNLPRTAPINDSPAARVAVDAAPFASNMSPNSSYKRNLRMSALSSTPGDYRSQLYRVDVTIYWYDRGQELSLSDSSIHRSP